MNRLLGEERCKGVGRCTAIDFVLAQFLAVVTAVNMFISSLLGRIALAPTQPAWHAPTKFATMIVMIAITLWAFRRTLGDRELV